MALNSATMPYEMLTLLKKIKICKISLVFGFIRQLRIESSIPDSIINFCVIYAFLKINEWYKGVKDHYIISESKLKVTLAKSKNIMYDWSTIFANPVITKGKHEWRFKMLTPVDFIYFGIASNMDCLEDNGPNYMFGRRSVIARNGGCTYCVTRYNDGKSHQMDHTMGNSIPFKQNDGEYFTFTVADTISVHLDLDNKTFGVSKNKEEIVIVSENIRQASYRFCITVWRDNPHTFKLCG